MSKFWAGIKKLVPRFNLSETEGKLKLFIFISGLLICLGLGSATAIQLTMSPKFCSSCHEMTPEYRTWQVTSHSNIRCTECHIEPGLFNLLKHKLGATKELYLHFTNSYERPIKMGHQIEDRICEQCHSPNNRRFSLSGDLIIPHAKHAAKGIKCVSCHSGVAHGDIASRKVTTQGNLSKLSVWTLADGKAQTEGKYARPKMNVCIDCHTSKKVTIKCEACHTSIAIPQNHKEASWATSHGTLAQKDINYCNKCHSYSNEGSNINTGNKVADYARGNALCYSCHQNLPSTHTKDWRIIHKTEARKNLVGCFICHNQNQPKPQDRATKTYCGACHSGAEVEADTADSSTMTISKAHESGWRHKHPQVVKEKGTNAGKCYQCHDRTACYVCHTGGGTN